LATLSFHIVTYPCGQKSLSIKSNFLHPEALAFLTITQVTSVFEPPPLLPKPKRKLSVSLASFPRGASFTHAEDIEQIVRHNLFHLSLGAVIEHVVIFPQSNKPEMQVLVIEI
jgi:hypothetical protein